LESSNPVRGNPMLANLTCASYEHTAAVHKAAQTC
jgi:hypothetical protein